MVFVVVGWCEGAGKLSVPVMMVGQEPIALAVGTGGGCLDSFSLVYLFSFLSLCLWETARYRLKYCLKGSLNPKPTNQNLMVIKFRNRLQNMSQDQSGEASRE